MSTCISEPVSYFRLERYELRELPADEQRSIAEHLAQCATCRACYERMHADERAQDVAELAAKLARPQPRAARGWLWGGGALAASLACLLFVLGPQPMAPGGGSAGTKGGELALELTRIDAQGEQRDPSRFAPGDRFKIAISCAPGRSGLVRVLAFQASETFEPLPAQTLASCGNRRALSGAFQLAGTTPIDVCVVLGETDQTSIPTRAALPSPHVCTRVEPAP